MADWKFVLGQRTGGHDPGELSEARGRKVTWRLAGSHEASCTLDARLDEAAVVHELSTDLHVIRDRQLLYRGRVGTIADTITAESHTIEVGSVDYRGVLRRRILYDDTIAGLTFTGVDQSAIAWALVADTQARTNADLGITRGVGRSTGVLRDRTEYKAGQSTVGDLIDDLSQVSNGFDWDVEPTSASGLAFNVYYPSRGRATDVILDYGGAVVSAERDLDLSKYANAVRVSGEDTTTAQKRLASDLASRPEGRWDAQFGYPDISVQATLNERADSELANALNPYAAWTVRLKPGWWRGPAHLWLGDSARLILRSGHRDIDSSLRVYEIDATVGESGDEDIRVTLGAPKPDPRRRQRQQARRLRDLERR